MRALSPNNWTARRFQFAKEKLIMWKYTYICVCVCVCVYIYALNWKIIALQNCVGVCHTSTSISHRYRYVPYLLNLPPTSHPIPPLQVDKDSWFVFPEKYSKFLLALYFTYGSVYVSILLSLFIPSSPSCTLPHIHMSVFYVCISITALQIVSSAPSFLDSTLMC